MELSKVQSEIILKLTGHSVSNEQLQETWLKLQQCYGSYVPRQTLDFECRMDEKLMLPPKKYMKVLKDFSNQLSKFNYSDAVNNIVQETTKYLPSDNLEWMNPHNLPPMTGLGTYSNHVHNSEKSNKKNTKVIPGKGMYKLGKQVHVNTSPKHLKKLKRRAKFADIVDTLSNVKKSTKHVKFSQDKDDVDLLDEEVEDVQNV